MKGKKKKRPVAHEVAIELLRKDPLRHIQTLTEMYKAETVVPNKDITKLTIAFQGAKIEIDSEIDKVVNILKKQLEKSKKEKK